MLSWVVLVQYFQQYKQHLWSRQHLKTCGLWNLTSLGSFLSRPLLLLYNFRQGIYPHRTSKLSPGKWRWQWLPDRVAMRAELNNICCPRATRPGTEGWASKWRFSLSPWERFDLCSALPGSWGERPRQSPQVVNVSEETRLPRKLT